MKIINNYIQEALIKKDTKLKLKQSFYQEYLIFIPYDNNYYYMENKYFKEKMSVPNFTIFLIKKSDAINVYNHLPSKKLCTDLNDRYNTIVIFKILENIDSKETLKKIIYDLGYADSPFGNKDTDWETIKTIDELK